MKDFFKSRNHEFLSFLALVFLPFTAVYFFTAFFNQINAMLAPYLSQELNMTPSELGWTTSIYLLVFSFAQLPVGILLDRYGPRKVQSGLFLLATVGIFIFATAQNSIYLLVGRGLIGIGMSSGLMSGFRAIRTWIPKEKVPLANACLMAIGTLGAVCSTIPVEIALRFMTWRTLLLIILAILLLVTAFIFLFVPEKPSVDVVTSGNSTLKQQIVEVKKIYKSHYFWRIAPLASFCFGSNMSIVGLWGGKWLSDVDQLSPLGVSKHLFVISMALICGIILWGILADKLMLYFKVSITRIIGTGAFLYIVVQILLVCGVAKGSYWLWFAFGLLSRCTTLSYAAMSQYFHHQYAARATAAINMLFFLTAFFCQIFIGWIVNLSNKNLMGHYPAHAYILALSCIILLQIFGFVWFCKLTKVELTTESLQKT